MLHEEDCFVAGLPARLPARLPVPSPFQANHISQRYGERAEFPVAKPIKELGK